MIYSCSECGYQWDRGAECLPCLRARAERYRAALGEILGRCEWRPSKHRGQWGSGAVISGPRVASICAHHGIDPSELVGDG